jgi:hypothetical protein
MKRRVSILPGVFERVILKFLKEIRPWRGGRRRLTEGSFTICLQVNDVRLYDLPIGDTISSRGWFIPHIRHELAKRRRYGSDTKVRP